MDEIFDTDVKFCLFVWLFFWTFYFVLGRSPCCDNFRWAVKELGHTRMYPFSCPVSLIAQLVKNLPTTQETWARPLGQEDPLEKEMAIHSSILAWRIPWTEEPGGLQSMGVGGVGHDSATELLWFSRQVSTRCIVICCCSVTESCLTLLCCLCLMLGKLDSFASRFWGSAAQPFSWTALFCLIF